MKIKKNYLRYLVSSDLKLFEFQQTIRKKLSLGKSECLFLFIAGNKLDKLSKFFMNTYNNSFLLKVLC